MPAPQPHARVCTLELLLPVGVAPIQHLLTPLVTSFTKGLTCPHADGPHLLRALPWLHTFSHAWGISTRPVVTSNSYCPKLFVTSHTHPTSALLFLSADLKFLSVVEQTYGYQGEVGWGRMDWGFAVVDANCYMNGLTRSYCIEKGNRFNIP